ncbi:MAG: acyltransferase family protein [Clostridiales bacterium]|jgi:fucose 4-O-acetylase-like acetyltransferase|nr:acyltransferase family protein [Clostridiales bacterium]
MDATSVITVDDYATLPKQRRDCVFDNIKLVLIVLVVFGHELEYHLFNNRILSTIYQFIYVFHMPAFVFIGGYFGNRGKIKPKLLIKLLILYMSFQILYTNLDRYLNNRPLTLYINYYVPYWLLWYLVAYIAYHIIGFVLPHNRHLMRGVLIVSIAASLLVGYLPLEKYAFSFGRIVGRIVVFLPYYILGMLSKPLLIGLREYVKKHFKVNCAMFIVLFTTTLLLLHHYKIPNALLYGSMSYKAIGIAQYGWLYRLCVVVVAILFIYCFVTLSPDKSGIVATLGQHTLSGFLVHGLILKLLYHYFDRPFGATIALTIVVMMVSWLTKCLVKSWKDRTRAQLT